MIKNKKAFNFFAFANEGTISLKNVKKKKVMNSLFLILICLISICEEEYSQIIN